MADTPTAPSSSTSTPSWAGNQQSSTPNDANLTTLLTYLQQGVAAINQATKYMKALFP